MSIQFYTNHGTELLLDTDSNKSSVNAGSASVPLPSADQAYDSPCLSLSSAVNPTHEIMSIFSMVSLGQHFVTLAARTPATTAVHAKIQLTATGGPTIISIVMSQVAFQ